MHIIIKKKYLIYKDFKVKCSLGKRGIGFKKKEGDLITPKGIFKIKNVFYRKDRLKKFKTSLKKSVIHKRMGWCDDPKSKMYNQLIYYPFRYNSEKLYRKDNIYDIIVVLDFNMKPIIKNKGSAIFLHVAKRNISTTKGCIAIKKNELKKLLGLINSRTRLSVI
tara:strand:- start:3942 stop:4433 length:492 start_codon:yes stop_codon:yes gene_type:complete